MSDSGAAAPGPRPTITGSVAHLLAQAALSNAPLALHSDQTVTAAQLNALASLGERFSRAGHELVVADSPDTLANLSWPVLGLASALVPTHGIAVSAAALLAEFSSGFAAADGVAPSVVDSAVALLALPASARALAGQFHLNADADVTPAQFLHLRDGLALQPGPHVLHVTGGAAALAALGGDIWLLGSATLAGPAGQTVTAAQLAALASFGARLNAAPDHLIAADHATALAALPGDAARLAAAHIVTQSAEIDAATARSLAALPGLSTAAGVALTLRDSADHLLALPHAAAALATSLALPGGEVTLTPAQAAGLVALGYAADPATTIHVAGSVAALSDPAHAGWQHIAAGSEVVDDAAAIARAAGSTLLQHARMVSLLDDTVTVAQARALAGIPHLNAAFGALIVADDAAAIAAELARGPASLLGRMDQIGAIEVTGGGPVVLTAAQILAPCINDGPDSALARLAHGMVTVTECSVAQLARIAHLPVPPASIAISDSAAHIAAELANPASSMIAGLASIGAIHVTDGMRMTLTDTPDSAAGGEAAPGVADGMVAQLSHAIAGFDGAPGLPPAAMGGDAPAPLVTASLAAPEPAHTVLRLPEAPHFLPGDAPPALPDLIDPAAVGSHMISAVLARDSIDIDRLLALSAQEAGGTVNIYDQHGHLLAAHPMLPQGITMTPPAGGLGHAFSITETINGSESAPVVVLDAHVLETTVQAAAAAFAASGAIEVQSGKYLNLYQAGAVPPLHVAALVFDPVAHTISLGLPDGAPVPLITLGAATHVAALDGAGVVVRHHG